MSDLSRAIIDAELPDGGIWFPKTNGGLDLFLSGMSKNHAVVRLFLSQLADLRSAERTQILDDLEREYGIENNTDLTEAVRRERLLAIQTEGKGTGSSDDLEGKLQAAGFDVQVHINNPPVDPALFLFASNLVVCGDPESVCGNPEAVCGSKLDDLIINGNIFITQTDLIPSDPGYWPMINFVGGDATRNGTTGALETIDRVQIPLNRFDEIRRLIVKYKPMYSWIGLIAEFV